MVNDTYIDLNAQVLASLHRLADTLSQLDETSCTSAQHHCAIDDELIMGTAAISIVDNDVSTSTAVHEESSLSLQKTPSSKRISHWRSLPPEVTSAYQLLTDGANYVHATSTKYTLISNTGDNQEGGDLAVELRKGAELLGTGSLLLFSESCGASRSLKHYVKLHVRAVLASVISLLQYFVDRNGSNNNSNNDPKHNIAAQKTGAIWSACEKLTTSLPRGNRAAMRRELMVWMRDCNESIAEFNELIDLGPINQKGVGGQKEEEGDNDEEEDSIVEQYTKHEIKLAKASVNLMKCSKNVLNLVMSVCECVGEHLEAISSSIQAEEVSIQGNDHMIKRDMLQYICNLHEIARSIGVGVTNFGVLMYPPLDMETDFGEVEEWLFNKKSKFRSDIIIPNLVLSPLGLKLDWQLHALLHCVESIREARSTVIHDCMTKEITEAMERLLNAVHVRSKEIEEAIYW